MEELERWRWRAKFLRKASLMRDADPSELCSPSSNYRNCYPTMRRDRDRPRVFPTARRESEPLGEETDDLDPMSRGKVSLVDWDLERAR